MAIWDLGTAEEHPRSYRPRHMDNRLKEYIPKTPTKKLLTTFWSLGTARVHPGPHTMGSIGNWATLSISSVKKFSTKALSMGGQSDL